jgi:dTDP-D-glucose 4,6-dehydratase
VDSLLELAGKEKDKKKRQEIIESWIKMLKRHHRDLEGKKILKIMGKGEDQIEIVADRPGHDRRYALDWSKAKAELGYQPEHDFDTYLKQTVDWYINHKVWWEALKHDRQ